MYETLANLVTVFHAALIVAVFLSILISIRYKRFRPIESLLLLSAVILWSLYDGCPLTYLENYLRIHAGNPLPIVEAGFIPFYLNKWLAFSVTDHQIVVTTYIITIVFFAISFKTLSPIVNFEIIKLRKFLGFQKGLAS